MADAKLRHKVIHLDKPPRKSGGAAAGAAKTDKAPKRAGKRGARRGLHAPATTPAACTYAAYEPLHRLWREYAARATQVRERGGGSSLSDSQSFYYGSLL